MIKHLERGVAEEKVDYKLDQDKGNLYVTLEKVGLCEEEQVDYYDQTKVYERHFSDTFWPS